jgi:hypothetical protein
MRGFPHRLAWLLISLAAAAADAAPEVPAPLEPWRAWVLRDQEFRACPLLAGSHASAPDDFLCAWPGTLALDAEARGVTIAQRWRVEVESWVPLPGDVFNWPQQVTVNGQPAPVVDHEGPALRLPAGTHEIRARIPWDERPETLRVPPAVGLIALTVDGRPVAPLQRVQDALTLGRGVATEPEADSLELHVYRKLSDGIPATLTTEIRISASGRPREETIGPVLPAGFEPLSLDSEDWPARLDVDGRLRVQVQPDSTSVTIEARALVPLAKVVARVPAAPWPRQEIWSYEAAPLQRVTSAASAVQVDPRQADVPDDWQTLPAFALGDGAELSVEERSRGLAPDEKNRLALHREMWLDFSGDAWFARDRITGEMSRGWRFDVAPQLTLERATALNSRLRDGNGESLLVTRGAAPGSTGVEWRTPAVDLTAGLRFAAARGAMPVTGWQDSFDRVTATLHLPSGYKLLGAPGADSAGGSWFSSWTLLDVFIAAIVVLLAWRLFGVAGAAAAAGYLVLGYQESGAPLWTLLAALAFGLIARALPAGRLSTAAVWVRRAALALLVLVALPFVAEQLRFALHPQLQGATPAYADMGLPRHRAPVQKSAEGDAMPQPLEEFEQVVAPPPPASAPLPESIGRDAEENTWPDTRQVSGANVRRTDIIGHYNQATVVQTGAGEPNWNLGERYVLGWSGPVLPNQTMRLVIAPPWLVRALRVALVALLAVLIVRLARGSLRMPPRAVASLGGVLAISLLAASAPVRAQAFPPEKLLDELHSRLLEAPKCVPACATLAHAAVVAHGDEIRVALEVHAASRVASPVPAGGDALTLRSVSVDGVRQDALARSKDEIYVALARGVHRVELAYAATADKVALRFPLRPMRVEFDGDGWQASGINESRLLTETLSLARSRETGSSASTTASQRFAPFVRVERDIMLGLDWSVSSTAQRLAPEEGGFTVSIPVLAGEHVTTSDVRTEGGEVIAAIADGESSVSWNSTLDKGDTLTLTAPALTDRAEVWHVTASPIWHVEASGVPVSADADTDRNDYRRFDFHPLPGETLTLRISRPEPAEGSTRAIDRAGLVLNAGQRASDAVLSLSMRASQGGEHVITLPAGAEVMNVTRNGETLNLRPRDGKLSLPLLPGSQTFQIRLREAVPVAFMTRTPAIALGVPAANIELWVDVPADRWLLAAFGPAQGPAVLYWSELAVMLLVAWALARTRRTPLKLWHWILLGIGFSTFSWVALVFVVVWLFALDWRARGASPASPVLFNLGQIGLALLTLIALFALAAAIPQGLLGSPDMHVEGYGSSAHALRWFADRSVDELPRAVAVSVPLWVYKLAMLAWALWLANAVVGWLRYGFSAWTRDGYWRALPRKSAVDIPAAAPPPPEARA